LTRNGFEYEYEKQFETKIRKQFETNRPEPSTSASRREIIPLASVASIAAAKIFSHGVTLSRDAFRV
jgi:hypothetical protein